MYFSDNYFHVGTFSNRLTISPYTLCLGGSDPFIVLDDAIIEKAAEDTHCAPTQI